MITGMTTVPVTNLYEAVTSSFTSFSKNSSLDNTHLTTRSPDTHIDQTNYSHSESRFNLTNSTFEYGSTKTGELILGESTETSDTDVPTYKYTRETGYTSDVNGSRSFLSTRGGTTVNSDGSSTTTASYGNQTTWSPPAVFLTSSSLVTYDITYPDKDTYTTTASLDIVSAGTDGTFTTTMSVNTTDVSNAPALTSSGNVSRVTSLVTGVSLAASAALATVLWAEDDSEVIYSRNTLSGNIYNVVARAQALSPVGTSTSYGVNQLNSYTYLVQHANSYSYTFTTFDYELPFSDRTLSIAYTATNTTSSAGTTTTTTQTPDLSTTTLSHTYMVTELSETPATQVGTKTSVSSVTVGKYDGFTFKSTYPRETTSSVYTSISGAVFKPSKTVNTETFITVDNNSSISKSTYLRTNQTKNNLTSTTTYRQESLIAYRGYSESSANANASWTLAYSATIKTTAVSDLTYKVAVSSSSLPSQVLGLTQALGVGITYDSPAIVIPSTDMKFDNKFGLGLSLPSQVTDYLSVVTSGVYGNVFMPSVSNTAYASASMSLNSVSATTYGTVLSEANTVTTGSTSHSFIWSNLITGASTHYKNINNSGSGNLTVIGNGFTDVSSVTAHLKGCFNVTSFDSTGGNVSTFSSEYNGELTFGGGDVYMFETPAISSEVWYLTYPDAASPFIGIKG